MQESADNPSMLTIRKSASPDLIETSATTGQGEGGDGTG